MKFDSEYDLLSQQVRLRYRRIIEEREKIIEAFIAETGLKPSEIELVEIRSLDEISWYVRKRKTA